MGNQFNWKIEEEPEETGPLLRDRRRRLASIMFWAVALILIGALLGRWAMARERGRAEQAGLIDTVQELLDLGQQAMSMGNGDLYFSLQEDNPDWFAAQLRPDNQAIVQSGLKVTNVEDKGAAIWANATWMEGDETLQRILFFQRRAGQLQRIAGDANYWGAQLQREETWGNLTYHAVDDPWATSVANFVSNKVAEICADNCLADRLPFTLNIRDDFQETAAPNQINIPSPHLLGLDEEGSPSSRFWLTLGQRLDAYLTPATIRFAVPPPVRQEGETVLPYRNLAERFMAANPDIVVEIVDLDAPPEDLAALAFEFDGAALLPTEEMLAAGHVHDLTDYISSDPDFDKGDYYEQIWQGALWRDRSWFLPEAVEMQVLYYDKAAYQRASHELPSSRWTWDEMAEDVSTIVADQPQPSELRWGFLDVGLDSLFSYAYNWNNQCLETATVFCQTPLTTDNVAAALDWYAQMASGADQMPNLTGELTGVLSSAQASMMNDLGAVIDDERQAMLLFNFQGAGRKAAIWVDSPVNYELNLLMSPVGIVPFPGSDRFDGISPLWLRGSFISQYSERPRAVWRWLKFLSYQLPAPRFIPARPSVAAEMGYWTILPRPLGDVMRTAFPFARPVTVRERGMLTWDQVTAVVAGELTPLEAAQQPDITWFSDQPDANPR